MLKSKLHGRILSIFIIFAMIFSGLNLPWAGGAQKAYAKEIGKKNEVQQQGCDAVVGTGALADGYTNNFNGNDYGSSVYRGGNAFSQYGQTANELNGAAAYPLDNDLNDFAKPLPYGNTYVDTSKLKWKDNSSGFIIDIQDDRFIWMIGGDDGEPEEFVDANGNMPINDPMGYGPVTTTGDDPIRGIYYRGELKAYLDNIRDAETDSGYINVIEPQDGKEYLYRITYLNAVTLPNGTRGNLVLTMKKIQIESSFEVSAENRFTATDDSGKPVDGAFTYDKALIQVQRENEVGHNTFVKDANGHFVNKRFTAGVLTAEEVSPWIDDVNASLTSGKLNETTWKTDKMLRNGTGGLYDLDIEVVDQEGNPVNGTISYAARDMDFESVQNIWGRPAGPDFSEGIKLVSGTKSYALVPDYEYADTDARVDGWVPHGPYSERLGSPLDIQPGNGNNADGVRFASAMMLKFRDKNGTLDNVPFNATEIMLAQGKGIAENTYVLLYEDISRDPLTNETKKLYYPYVKEKYSLTRWQDVTADMIFDYIGDASWKTYRNDSSTFDSGFAVLLDAGKSSIQYSASRATGASVNTTLFDSSMYTYIETTHGTGGGIYLERYDLDNSCEIVMEEGVVTMGRYSDSTVTIVPEDGYRVNRILVGDTNFGFGSDVSGLRDYTEYVIDGNELKDADGNVLGTFAGSDTVDGFDELKTGVIEVAGFKYDVAGNRVALDDKKIRIERNADGTVDVTVPEIDNPMHVHGDFAADYYFYKVWKDGTPVPLNMTAASAGFYPTKVTLPVPTGEYDEEGLPITQDVEFEIDGNIYKAQSGTYVVSGQDEPMSLEGVEFVLTSSNTLEYTETDEETGDELLGIRPNVILEGNKFVHKTDDVIDHEYEIEIEERLASWDGADAKKFVLDITKAGADEYITEETGDDNTIIWKVRYPSEGVEALGWPELPVEDEPSEANHNASNHSNRHIWFVIEEAPSWSTAGYDNTNAEIPGKKEDRYYHNSIWYQTSIKDNEKYEKLVHEDYVKTNAVLSVFEDGGEIVNVPSILVRGRKVWEDENNAYNNRKDIWLHIDSQVANEDGSVTIKKDVLPPQKIAKTATENGLVKTWGEKKSYDTGVSTIKVVASQAKVPSNAKLQADGSYKRGSTIYWVNELKKEAPNGNVYEYTIRETLDREGDKPVEKDNIDAGLLGYTSKDVAEWSELSTEKTNSSEFVGKDTAKISGQDVIRYSGEVKNTLEIIDVEAEKIWDDNDDQDGYRTDITFTLEGYNGDLPASQEKTVTVDKDATGDNLKVKWEKLPAYKDGVKVNYSVSEAGYDEAQYSATSVVTEDNDGNIEVKYTNTHIPETASISIFKKWDDKNNQDGLRKEAAKVLLEGKTDSESQYISVSDQDGAGITQGIVPVKDGLIITWLNIPVKRNHGEDITYKIYEDITGLGGYYTDPTYVDETFTLTKGENKEATITNKETPKLTKVTITKKWDDMDDHDGIRPDKVTVQLVKTYKEIQNKTEDVNKQVTVNGKKYYVKQTADGDEYFVIGDKYYRGDDIKKVDDVTTDYEELITFAPNDNDESVKIDKTVDVDGQIYDVMRTSDGTEYYVIGDGEDATYYDPAGTELIPGEDRFEPSADDEIAKENKVVLIDEVEYEVKITEDGDEYYVNDGKYYDLDGNELVKFAPKDDDEIVQVEAPADPEYKDKVEKQDIVLSAANKWTATITDLNVNEPEGQKVVYSVEEANVPKGYKASITSTKAGEFTVTNKHEVTIKPPKAWPDTTEDYKGKPQTGIPTFKADPDTKAPGGGENKIERITLVDDKGREVNEITVPGEGTYKLTDNGDGTCSILFIPEPDFVGKAKGVKVRGYDSNGLSADTTYTPIVKHKVKYVDPLNPKGKQTVEGPRDCNTPDASDDSSDYEGKPGTPSKNHPGYRFDGWEEKEIDDPDHPGDKITVRTAKYTPMYNINYDPNGGTGEMSDNNYPADKSKMPHDKNTFTRDGYKFIGFKAYITDPTTGKETVLTDKDGNPIIFQNSNDMKKYFEGMPGGTSIRMEAQWKKLPTAIYVDPATGRTIQKTLPFLDENTEPPAPEDPTRKGYRFVGWDRIEEYDEDGDLINVRYEAKWEKIESSGGKNSPSKSGKRGVKTGDESSSLLVTTTVLLSAMLAAILMIKRRRYGSR